MEKLLNALYELVKEFPGEVGRVYARLLRMRGFSNITKSDVNRILYGRRDLFKANVGPNLIPAWSVLGQILNPNLVEDEDELIEEDEELEEDDFEEIDNQVYEDDEDETLCKKDYFSYDKKFDLRKWQQEALDAWEENCYKGIVEAVTGSGKTRVAIAAIDAHLKKGWKVFIIVPNITLLNQWDSQIQKNFGTHYYIGQLGKGNDDDLYDHDIIISTRQSAHKLFYPDEDNILVIADEVHNYGTEKSELFLSEDFNRRLGLTASLERSDEGVEKILLNYFSQVIYQYDYADAIDEKVISPFEILYLSVPMDEEEQEDYESYSRKISRLKNTLQNRYPRLMNNYHLSHNQKISRLKKIYDDDISIYTGMLSKRNQMVMNMQSKLKVIPYLSDSIASANGTFIFTQFKNMNHKITEQLKKEHILIEGVDSDVKDDKRAAILKAFEDKKIISIAAPRILDEGVDVPHADLAIITGKSKTKRQMIQRIGRVVRTNNNNKTKARIIIVYSKDTVEDPRQASEESFYSVFETATKPSQNIEFDEYNPEELTDFLEEWMSEE